MDKVHRNSKVSVKPGISKEAGFEDNGDTTCIALGRQACRAEKGCRQQLRGVDEDEDCYKNPSGLITHVEHHSKGYIADETLKAFNFIQKFFNVEFFQKCNGTLSELFAGKAISKNTYLNAHTDDDFGMSAMMVLADDPSALKLKSEVLAYTRVDCAASTAQ